MYIYIYIYTHICIEMCVCIYIYIYPPAYGKSRHRAFAASANNRQEGEDMQERVKGGGGVHDPLKFKVRI